MQRAEKSVSQWNGFERTIACGTTFSPFLVPRRRSPNWGIRPRGIFSANLPRIQRQRCIGSSAALSQGAALPLGMRIADAPGQRARPLPRNIKILLVGRELIQSRQQALGL